MGSLEMTQGVTDKVGRGKSDLECASEDDPAGGRDALHTWWGCARTSRLTGSRGRVVVGDS